MKKNNKIISFINNYRKIKSVNLFIENFLLLFIAMLSLFMFFVILERFVFFSPDTRIRMDIFLILLFLSLLILFIVKLFFQIKGKLINFRNKDIAKEIGTDNINVSDKLINALQLNENIFSNDISRNLKNRAIESIESQIPKLDKNNYKEPFKKKRFSVLLFVVFISMGIIYNNEFTNASIRMLNPDQRFEVPKPYEIINKFQANQILEGDSLNLQFRINSEDAPDSIDVILLNKTNKKEIAIPNQGGWYKYTIKNVLDDLSYWAEYKSNSIFDPWEKIKSEKYNVGIIKRPRINSIEFIVTPPDYSKLEKTYYSANNTDISMIEGSSININARANKVLAEAWLESGDNLIPLYVENNYIKDDVTFTSSCNIILMCEDKTKIKNINPPLNKINVIKVIACGMVILLMLAIPSISSALGCCCAYCC